MPLTTKQARSWLPYLTAMLKPTVEGNMNSGATQQQESNKSLRYIGKVTLASRAGIAIEGDDSPYLFAHRTGSTYPLPMEGETVTLFLDDDGLIHDWQPFSMDNHIDRLEVALSTPLAHPEGYPSPERRMQLLALAIRSFRSDAGYVPTEQVIKVAEELERWCYA